MREFVVFHLEFERSQGLGFGLGPVGLAVGCRLGGEGFWGGVEFEGLLDELLRGVEVGVFEAQVPGECSVFLRPADASFEFVRFLHEHEAMFEDFLVEGSLLFVLRALELIKGAAEVFIFSGEVKEELAALNSAFKEVFKVFFGNFGFPSFCFFGEPEGDGDGDLPRNFACAAVADLKDAALCRGFLGGR